MQRSQGGPGTQAFANRDNLVEVVATFQVMSRYLKLWSNKLWAVQHSRNHFPSPDRGAMGVKRCRSEEEGVDSVDPRSEVRRLLVY
jgi:hypothetical protein